MRSALGAYIVAPAPPRWPIGVLSFRPAIPWRVLAGNHFAVSLHKNLTLLEYLS